MSTIVIKPKGKSSVFKDCFKYLEGVKLSGGFYKKPIGYIIDINEAIAQILPQLSEQNKMEVQKSLSELPRSRSNQWYFKKIDFEFVELAEAA